MRRWRFLARFDFYVGITIIVETNKKVELFPWTDEVQAVIWIAKCIKIFFATGSILVISKKEVPESKKLLVKYYESEDISVIAAFMKERCWETIES